MKFYLNNNFIICNILINWNEYILLLFNKTLLIICYQINVENYMLNFENEFSIYYW